MLKTTGILNHVGEIVLLNGKTVNWKTFGEEKFPLLPAGINVELTVSVSVNSLISGIDGYVWVTKDIHQAEIINNALKIQRIESEIVNTVSNKTPIYLIKVNEEKDIKTVIDFIQNERSGLRLKPDWDYPEGERNQSFEQWINE